MGEKRRKPVEQWALLEQNIRLLATCAVWEDTAPLVVPTSYRAMREQARALNVADQADQLLANALFHVMAPCSSSHGERLRCVARTLIEVVQHGYVAPSKMISYISRYIVMRRPMFSNLWTVLCAMALSLLQSYGASITRDSRLELSTSIIETLFHSPSKEEPPRCAVDLLSILPLPESIVTSAPSTGSSKAASGSAPTAVPLQALSRTAIPPSLRDFVSGNQRHVRNVAMLTSRAGTHQLTASTVLTDDLPLQLKTVSKSRDTAIWTHYNLITERAPLYMFRPDVNHEAVTKRRSLCGAVVLRILTLIASSRSRAAAASASATTSSTTPGPTEHPPPTPSVPVGNTNNSKSIMTSWKGDWGEWLILSDQLNAFLLHGLVEFEEFVMMLVHSGKSYFGGAPLRDNCIVWLVTQMMPLEVVKQTLSIDFNNREKRGAHLADCLTAFHDPSSGRTTDGQSELLDSAIACLFWRLRALSKDFVMSSAPSNSVDMLHEHYGAWWKRTADALDFFELDEASILKLAVLSHISSQVVADRVVRFLNDDSKDARLSWQTLPGQLVFSGRTKPLQTALLYNLSIQCRNRIASGFMDRLLDPPTMQIGASKIMPPGLLETYVRLLYIAPFALHNHLGKLYSRVGALRTLPAFQAHTLLELANYRLYRLVKHQSALKMLFQTIGKALSEGLPHPQLRIIRLSYRLSSSEQLSSVLHERPSHHQALQWMPETMRIHLANRPPEECLATISWADAQSAARRPEFASLLDFRPKLDEVAATMAQNPTMRSQFLCIVAMIWLQHQSHFLEYEYNFQTAIHHMLPSEVPDAAVCLVHFLINALQSGRIASATNMVPVQVVSALLVQFAWDSRLVPIDLVILALCDRTDCPESFTIIRELLITNDAFAERIELLAGPDAPVVCHWEDPDYLQKHTEYQTTFAEISSYDSAVSGGMIDMDPVLPVYYGNLCVKIVPVLDVLIGRLVEHEHKDLLQEVVMRFRKLYALYHHSPISYVLDSLKYYDGSLALDLAVCKALLRLCTTETSSEFSNEFVRYVSCDDDDEEFAFSQPSFFLGLLLRLSDQITIVSSAGVVSETSPQFFHEFQCSLAQVLSTTQLELLTIPVSLPTICRSMLAAALDTDVSSKPSSSKIMHALALLLDNLPSRYMVESVKALVDLYQQCVDELSGEELDEASPFWTQLLDSDWKSLSVSLLDNRYARLLSATHHIISHSPATLQSFVTRLSSSITAPISPLPFHYLCRSFSPFLVPSGPVNEQDSAAYGTACMMLLHQLAGCARRPSDYSPQDKIHVDAVMDFTAHAIPSLLPHIAPRSIARMRILRSRLPAAFSNRLDMSVSA
ncbi:unnamed protein product (mitochondrion) [Plasmodiophora brassicae]|uniref:Uncharacterized protein n=1 Tax=Plasmodiophora brassicae TaxID=37360 RepID=A0A3P3YG43_PLABS|nr:unnamed protein product [Plasmodiophora brassicae]